MFRATSSTWMEPLWSTRVGDTRKEIKTSPRGARRMFRIVSNWSTPPVFGTMLPATGILALANTTSFVKENQLVEASAPSHLALARNRKNVSECRIHPRRPGMEDTKVNIFLTFLWTVLWCQLWISFERSWSKVSKDFYRRRLLCVFTSFQYR